MGRARMAFLAKDEIEKAHATSLRILSEVGIVLHSEKVTRILLDAGAELSQNRKRVLIPESLVMSSLKSAKRPILLASADKKHDLSIPNGPRTYCACGGEGVYVKDLVSGESHYATSDDLQNFTILVEETPQVDFWWGLVGATEMPTNLKYLAEVKIAFEHTTKHVQAMASGAEEARRSIEMASIIAGGEDALSKRPVLSACLCPISPLAFEGGLTEAQVEFAKAGVPVVAMSAAVAGLTSPVTLSGTIAQVTAENLASMVISQMACKGAPWIFSSDSSAGDLKTGSIDYRAFESLLLRTGMGEMGRYYGLPTMVAAPGLEAVATSIGSIEEGVPYMVLQALVDSDLGSGFGGIDQAAGSSYEQLLVDAWVWEAARLFVREFDFDDSSISFDTIRDGAITNNFLNKRHTISRFKKEFSSMVVPEARLGGPSEPHEKGELIKSAWKKAREILGKPREPLISKYASRQMEEIMARAK